MLPAQRAGARGADPWHAMHREAMTKVGAKQDARKKMRREGVTKVEVKHSRQTQHLETAIKAVAKQAEYHYAYDTYSCLFWYL